MGLSVFVLWNSCDDSSSPCCKIFFKRWIYLICILPKQYLNICGVFRITELVKGKKVSRMSLLLFACTNGNGKNMSIKKKICHLKILLVYLLSFCLVTAIKIFDLFILFLPNGRLHYCFIFYFFCNQLPSHMSGTVFNQQHGQSSPISSFLCHPAISWSVEPTDVS